jgi:hypothetical protein
MFGLSTPRLIAYGVALLAVAGAAWWFVATLEKANERDQAIADREQLQVEFDGYRELVQTSAIRAVAALERDAGDDRELAEQLDALDRENARLRWLASLPPATIEVPDANGNPSVRINPVWWLCTSALVSRDPADMAACEARAGDAGVPHAVGP